MAQKILLAVDGSEQSGKAVEYVGDTLCSCRDIEITIFHALETPFLAMADAGHVLETRVDFAQLAAENLERAEKEILQRAEQLLKERNGSTGRAKIRTKLDSGSSRDVARAIIREVEAGGYDTVVLGRRGMSVVKEFMFGSVSSKVVHHIENCTIWIVE
jgi:nucleotide-binding universal stress UspA family protein